MSITYALSFATEIRNPSHGNSPDKANMHAKAAMPSTTFQTHEYSVRYGCPLWVLRLAIDADLDAFNALKKSHHRDVEKNEPLECTQQKHHADILNTSKRLKSYIYTLFSGFDCKSRKRRNASGCAIVSSYVKINLYVEARSPKTVLQHR